MLFQNVMGVKSQKQGFSFQISNLNKTTKQNNVQVRARGLCGTRARFQSGRGQIVSCSGGFALGSLSCWRWSQALSLGNKVLCASPWQRLPPVGSSGGSTRWPGGLLELGPPVGPPAHSGEGWPWCAAWILGSYGG